MNISGARTFQTEVIADIKYPEAGAYLTSSKSGKEASVPGAECRRQRVENIISER